MDKHCTLSTSCGILLLVQTVAFEGLASVGGDAVLGGGAYVVCTYVTPPTEEVSNFYIWRLPFPLVNTDDYYFMIPKLGDPVHGKAYHNRLSIHVNNSGTPGVSSAAMTATMWISYVACSDEATYGCEFAYTTQGQVPHTYKTSSRLAVKAHPKLPVLTLETDSVHPTAEQVWVYEGSTVSAKCTANLGRPGYGIIEWRIYHGKELTYITDRDKRVEAMQQVTLLPEDPTCTERVEQRFHMKVFRQDQELAIACFVHNANFPRTQPSLYCKNISVDMCSLSDSFCIINVPNEDDDHKSLLTLTCVILAGLLTIIIVQCKIWRCCCPKKQPPTKSQPSATVTPSSNLDNIEETETLITEEVETVASDEASTQV